MESALQLSRSLILLLSNDPVQACLATVMPRAHELGGESRRQVGMLPSTVYSPKWQSSTVNPKPNMRNCWQGCGKLGYPKGRSNIYLWKSWRPQRGATGACF